MDTLKAIRPRQLRKSKAFGAYYTDEEIANFLAWWAIKTRSATMIDPCFGTGVFLHAGCKRLAELHGNPRDRVFGVEIDREVRNRTVGELQEKHSLRPEQLRLDDFFRTQPTREFDAVIGNPPFIRYQRFNGQSRKAALKRSAEAGVRLPELCSAWAPFLVHCIAVLRKGGRLAMVVPMEIGHAKYAQPVLAHLHRSFETIRILTFEKRLFPELSEDTALLLAENKGVPCARSFLHELIDSRALAEIKESQTWPTSGAHELDAERISTAKSRLVEYFLPARARDLYRELASSDLTQRLKCLGEVGIGYVTGANDFFHLSPQRVKDLRIPFELLKPVVKRGRALRGLRFTSADWHDAAIQNEAAYLLHIQGETRLRSSVMDYIRFGESLCVDKKYKCRTRSPWYSVPHVHLADAFLSYMSGATPRLVANDASVYAPNSLHIVRLHPQSQVSAIALSVLWQTSLTRLSVEVEGHALGGGMLKLEPTEAKNVLIPNSNGDAMSRIMGFAEDLEPLVRSGKEDAAREQADRSILIDLLGLTKQECNLLWRAANTLRSRRGYKGAVNGTD